MANSASPVRSRSSADEILQKKGASDVGVDVGVDVDVDVGADEYAMREGGRKRDLPTASQEDLEQKLIAMLGAGIVQRVPTVYKWNAASTQSIQHGSPPTAIPGAGSANLTWAGRLMPVRTSSGLYMAMPRLLTSSRHQRSFPDPRLRYIISSRLSVVTHSGIAAAED
ncbi:hypothetical protein J7T55_004067 [Diaporthe amygdali]|uniref:uncharacterized protein n=1 Tax=Phomopsis amygdali TaxID=1214568 RepID=UPI0022FF2984|nr:uncharacterized protein J7T55_004067 [Diaporthe amygdali]KAJ0115898.1 hypothetical protein J7T55_004067 [Diaporthe amygdali]